MTIFKNRDIATDIKVTGVDIGDIGAKFYTEDENTASITLHIKFNGVAFDLTQSTMRPKLDLFTQDGSIFLDEKIEIVDSVNGIIKYKIGTNVIKHVGAVKAKLFLWSETESVHVADFQFMIGDSGVDKAIAKEIDVNLVDNAINKLINANPEQFTGKSAYQVAVANGFVGTEQEWLVSLKHEPERVVPLLEPYAKKAAVDEFNKLSAAKQVDGEVIASRGTYAALPERLDNTDKIISVTRNDSNREVIANKSRRPIMTFIDDDGRVENFSKWKPIVAEKKIPLSICLITDKVGKDDSFMTWQQIHELVELGVEFTNHTHTHILLGNQTEAVLRSELENSKRILREHGLQDDILVYPGGSQSELVRRVAREYFRAAVSTAEALNTPPLKTFSLNRKTLAESGYNTLEYYKQQVDAIVANNGWCIWKSHSQYTTFDDIQIGYIKELIDYARSKGVEIVNMKRGLDIYGNIFDSGDYVAKATGAEYTIIDVDGKLESKHNSLDFRYIYNFGSTINTPITSFKTGITREMIQSGQNTGFPNNKSGILDTSRMTSNSFSFQEFFPYDSNQKYKRTWNATTNGWNAWESVVSIADYRYISANGSTPDTPISSFQSGITRELILSGSTTGFPENQPGTLETSKMKTDSFSFQDYYIYNNNKHYRRTWNASAGTWNAWERLDNSRLMAQNKQTVTATIPAGKVVEVVLSMPGITNNDNIMGSPVAGLEVGLMFSVMIGTADQIRVRLFNSTSSDISINRPFKFDVIKV